MVDFVYSTKPNLETLRSWARALEPVARDFLREHPLQVPFWYYGYPGRFAEAAAANVEIQENIRDWPAWRTADQRAHPAMRFEFDMVVAIGGMEVFSWSKNKDWGMLDWIAPLLPDDPVGPVFLTCIHNPATSKWHRRREQRWWLRRKLGRGNHSLVSDAIRSTKEEWVAKLTTGMMPIRWIAGDRMVGDLAKIQRKHCVKVRSDGARCMKGWVQREPDIAKARTIRRTLDMNPEQFWQIARCNQMLRPEEMADFTPVQMAARESAPPAADWQRMLFEC